jgi:DNA-binding NarL/FixJ family response regulator
MAALLERERELQMLREGMDRAIAGEGTLVLIEGPAGVGKTVLARAAGELAEQTGLRVLEARASELEQPFGFGVVRQLLESEAMGVAGKAALFAGPAGPAARLFEPDEPHPRRVEAGFEALHSLYWLVVHLADREPVLLSVDDCQWADADSLRFFAYLARRIEGLAVMMLLAGRSPDSPVDDARPLWPQLLSNSEAVALSLRPLSEAAAVALVRERLGAAADEGFCRSCHSATGGNPLFLRELLRALEAAEVTPSAAAADGVQTVGPATVSRFVLHRLASLGPPATELARAVAVLGDDTEPALAGRVAGLSEAAARAAADLLARADVFARAGGLSFVHPIVRAALYDDLAPGERQARHGAAAEALAREGASSERITAHLLLTVATGEPWRVKTLRSAGASAARRGAPEAAARCLHRALGESPAEQERGEILAELGRCEVSAMRFEVAEEHLQAAISSGADLGTRAAAASDWAHCAIASDGYEAEAAADALASVAGELRPVDLERSLDLGAALLMLTAAIPRLRGRLGESLPRFCEQARGHPHHEAVANIHVAHERLANGGSAAAAAADVQAALAVGLPPAMATTVFSAIGTLRHAERYEPALRLLEALLEQARGHGHAARQGLVHGIRALIALERGSLQDAQVEAETGLRLAEEPHFVLPLLVAVTISVQIERGELVAAAEMAETARGHVLDQDRAFLPDYLIARGRLRIAEGRLGEGVEDLLWAGQRLESRNYHWPAVWKALAASALASLGETEEAARLAREHLAMARRVGAPGMLGLSLRHAAATVGEQERLVQLEEAVAVLEQSSARLELAHALAELGMELSRAGRRREGRSAQRKAMELAQHCGAVALAKSARSELEAGPGRRARIELTGTAALTAAEWRVCRQAAEGRTNREIAQSLFVTEKTIERHLSSSYHKLRVRSRFQLLAAIGDEFPER